jgi:ABC-type nitrate/sulfonate/bicarbonate transport system permease component
MIAVQARARTCVCVLGEHREETVADVRSEASRRRSRPPRQRKVAERSELSRAGRLFGGCLGLLLVPAVWQLLSDTHVINSFVWSSPSGVWDGLTQLIDNGSLGPACWSSLRLFLWGFAIAAVSGVALGIALGWYRRTRAVVDPWVSMLYAAPRVGLIPIIIAAAGIETRSQIIIVWVSAVFPIIINTAAGVDAVDPRYVRTAQSFLATNRDVLRGIALPGATPLIFAGLRQGLTAGLIGVVIAEYFLGNNGVGGLIITASGSGQTGEAFVGAFLFSLTAVALTSILRLFERRVSRWR